MTAGFLAALQLADSALPIGRFVHSNGLEALLRADADAGEDTIADIVRVFVTECVAPLDGVVLAHAHRATGEGDVERLVQLDRLLETFKTTPAARLASTSCGHRLVALAPLLVDSPELEELARLIAGRRTPGNLAVVEGAVARALGVDCEAAVLIELRGAATGLFSAAVRLGRLSALRAQGALRSLEPLLRTAAEGALRASTDFLRAAAPELEIYALRHWRADARLFMT
jgi:urease accessory protein